MREAIQNVGIGTFKRILAPAYRARIPVLAIGHKGIGKSEVVKAFCLEHDLECIDIRLAYLEAQDIVGFPYRDEKTGTMAFAAPNWLPREGKGILFLDEINRARIDVLQAVFQLVRDREIGGIINGGGHYRLPEGWAIVSAMNPETPDEQYYVSPMDESLYDRFLKVAVVSDLNDFRRYAKSSDFHHEVSSFIVEDEISISKDALPPVEVDATPRSFEMFDRLFRELTPSEEDILPVLASGLIGPGNAEKFLRYREGFYREVQTLLKALIVKWGDDPSLAERCRVLRDERNDILMSLRDHFVQGYIRNEEAYSRIKDDGGLERFVRFAFSLYDEQIVAYLVALREGYGESRQGLYLTDILGIIMIDDELRRIHERIVGLDPALHLEEHI